MQTNEEKILEIVKQKGPSLPSDIYKQLGTNLLFASAMLGETVSAGALKVTHLKRGSSPYYYLEEHKEKLQDISQYLNDKDRIAYALLKEKKVLKDVEQTPLNRVALRTIKDYAVPLNVNLDGNVQLFWKWYLLSNQEAEEKIKVILGLARPQEQKELKKEDIKQEEPKIEQKKAVQKEKIESKKEEIKQKELKVVEEKEKPSLEEKPKIPQEGTTPFLDRIIQYFSVNKIMMHTKEIMNRQKTEIDFLIEMPSPVGNLLYYCKAKDKKKISDGDIASALVQGQQKRLPTLVLINGEMTKRTKEMMNREFKGLAVYKL